jgi:hypothetical protein
MTTQIKKVYELFYDKNNALLENGYIYIGFANQNPITNPIQTYFDADLTIPALQPLRTVGGAISNNGSPANVYIAVSDYSIVVQDKNKVTLYSTLERTSETATSELNYTNGLYTGGIQQNLQDVVERAIDFKDFGAKGDGVTDDTPAINALLTQIGDEGARLKFSDGQYLLKSAIRWGLAQRLQVDFSKNAILVPFTNTFDMMTIEGSRPSGTYQNLTADALSENYSITTASTIAGANVGDYLGIQSSKLLSGANSKGTKQFVLKRIVAISGTTYYFNDILGYDFLTSDTAEAGLADMRDNYYFYGININNRDAGNVLFSRGLVIKQGCNIQVDGISAYGSKLPYEPSTSYVGKTALLCSDTLDSVFRDGKLEQIGYYGVAALFASDNLIFDNFTGRDMRHLFDITWASNTGGNEGEPNNIKFQSSTGSMTTESCFSTHDTGRYIVFDNCTADTAGIGGVGSYGFYSRNVGSRFSKCKAFRATLDGFRADTASLATNYDACEAVENQRDGFFISTYGRMNNVIATRNGEAGIAFNGGTLNSARIVDNGISGTSPYAIQCGYYASTETYNISDVDAPASSTQTIGIRFETASGVDPRNNVFISGKNILTGYGNNLYSVSSGDNAETPITSGNIATAVGTSSNPVYGRATLTAGAVTVSTTAVRDYNPASGTTGKFTSKITPKAISFTNAGALYTSAITDATSFDVNSTNGAGTQEFEYEVLV